MEEDAADAELLSLATEDTGKFAIGIDYKLSDALQLALERGMQNEWFRLVDVSVAAESQGHICRIFLLTAAGRWRLKRLKSQQCTPAIEPEQPATAVNDDRPPLQVAIDWMQGFADRAGLSYDGVIEIGREHLATGYIHTGYPKESNAYRDDPSVFWMHFGAITGITPPANPTTPFSPAAP